MLRLHSALEAESRLAPLTDNWSGARLSSRTVGVVDRGGEMCGGDRALESRFAPRGLDKRDRALATAVDSVRLC